MVMTGCFMFCSFDVCFVRNRGFKQFYIENNLVNYAEVTGFCKKISFEGTVWQITKELVTDVDGWQAREASRACKITFNSSWTKMNYQVFDTLKVALWKWVKNGSYSGLLGLLVWWQFFQQQWLLHSLQVWGKQEDCQWHCSELL